MSCSLCLLCNATAHGERFFFRARSARLTPLGAPVTTLCREQGRVPMRRSQPASEDSEDADTVATADCSRWRNGVERQARPDAHAHQVAAVGGSSTDGVRRVRARTAPRMNDDASSSSQLPGGSPGGRPTAAERAEALSVIGQMKEAEPPILSRRGAPPTQAQCGGVRHRAVSWRGVRIRR